MTSPVLAASPRLGERTVLRRLIGSWSKRRKAAIVWAGIELTVSVVLLTQPAIATTLLLDLRSAMARVFLAANGLQS